VHITIESSDQHLLDLLATPSTISLQLVQEVRMDHYAPEPSQPRTIHKVFSPPEPHHREVAAVGSCWFPVESQQSQSARQLEGEIIVRKDLKPSFTFPSFSLHYTVQLYFHADGFSTNQTNPLISEPVKIVTDRTKGIIPQSRSPYRPL